MHLKCGLVVVTAVIGAVDGHSVLMLFQGGARLLKMVIISRQKVFSVIQRNRKSFQLVAQFVFVFALSISYSTEA